MSEMITAAVEPSVAAVGSGDRLGFTFFLALVLHVFIILGVSAKLPEPPAHVQTIEVTLATHKSNKAPDKADFLAQQNQEASGTEEQARQLATERRAEFADTQIRDVNPVPETQAAAPTKREDQRVITAAANSSRHVQLQVNPEPLHEQELREGLLQEQTFTSEIASLQAKLDRQQQEYAKRPRVRRLTSVATKESFDAQYLHEWSSKIEQIGNENYPAEALNRRITGNLRLSVVINPDGSIYEIKILQSSGQRILDQAAQQIVRLAAPFATFPPEIRRQADKLQIIRTWSFEISGLSTTSN